MYMTNEEWKQNNQDYLKESYEETGFTTGGYAVRKLICGGCGRVFYTTIYTKKYCHSYWCGNQANNLRQREYRQMRRAKCAVRIWSASAAVKNSRPNVQMPDIAATPADKKSIENVLQMLQVLKMSTWLSVTHLPNKTQSLTNGGTEIHRPVTENQVVKMSTSFFRNASRSIENQVPPPGT